MSLLIQAAEYVGNFALNAVVYFKFSVTDATGVLTTLGGTPVVKVYKDSGTTESTAGVTLTVDFDSRTGLCQVAIDTSSDATFYAAGHDFEAVLTAGTVGVVSVAGTPVGHFSLLNRVDTLADGVTHGGTTALVALKRLTIANNTSDAAFGVSNSVGDTVTFTNTAVSSSVALLVSTTGSGSHGIKVTTQQVQADCIHIQAIDYSATGIYVAGGGIGVRIQGSADSSNPGTALWLQTFADEGQSSQDTNTIKLSPQQGNCIQGLANGSSKNGILLAGTAGGHDINLAGTGDILGNLTGTVNATLVAAGLDAVLVESGITAGAGLTNDAGSQLTSINLRQAVALAISVLEGVLAGAAGTTVTTKPAGKPSGNTRVTATVDSDGNRSALTLKVPT